MNSYDFGKTNRFGRRHKGPLKMIIIVLVIITMCFVAARYFIMKESSSPLNPSVKMKRVPPQTKEQVKRWQYVKSLENATSPKLQPSQPLPIHLIQSSLDNNNEQATTTKETTTHHWQVLCGNFISKDQAEQIKASLAFIGVESHIKFKLGSYKVWAGEPQRYVQAQVLQQKINQDKRFSCLVLAVKG